MGYISGGISLGVYFWEYIYGGMYECIPLEVYRWGYLGEYVWGIP